MRLGTIGAALLAGCGGILGASSDDETSAPSPSPATNADGGDGGDAMSGTGESDGGGEGASDAADAGKDGSVPIPCIGGACEKRIFVTQARYDGNLGGVAGADAKCQAAGDAFMPGRSWRAWLSGLSDSVDTRHTKSTGDYVSGNGPMAVANGWAGLASTTHLRRIMDEMNGLPPVDDRAWTGTTPTGGSTGNDCTSWTAVVGTGLIGSAAALDATWSDLEALDCTQEAHLYCVEQ